MATQAIDITKVSAPEVNIRATSPQQVAAIAQRLEQMKESSTDWITPARDIHISGDDEDGITQMEVNHGLAYTSYSMTPIAHRNLANTLGIPTAYYNKMAVYQPELLALNANKWLQAEHEEKMYLLRTYADGDDHVLRAQLSQSYQCLDSHDLFFSSYKTLQEVDAQVTRVDLTEERFYMRALKTDWALRIERQMGEGRDLLKDFGHFVPDEQRQRARDDEGLVIPGVVISNSDVGMGRLRVEPFIQVVACVNGYIIDESLAVVHLGARHEIQGILSDETKQAEAAAVWGSVKDLTRAIFDQDLFKKFVEMMSTGTALVLDNPVEAVDNVVEHFGFSDTDKQTIINELIAGRDSSVFGLMQAITATGRDKANYNDSVAFERAGADLIKSQLGGRELVRVR